MPRAVAAGSVSGPSLLPVPDQYQPLRARDSEDPDGPVLTFPPGQWAAFLRELKAR